MTGIGGAAASVAAPTIPQEIALGWQLAMFAGNEPDSSFLEFRFMRDGRLVQRHFLPVHASKRLVRFASHFGMQCDVFVGCAPRTSNTSGTLRDISLVWCLWCDCDSPEATNRLRYFKPAPSIVVRSGGKRRTHAYWALECKRPLSVEAADRCNRRLALALGADRCSDASRVLRPVGGINFKYNAVTECVRLEPNAFKPDDIVGGLPDDDRYKPRPIQLVPRRRVCGDGSGLVRTVATAQVEHRNKTLFWAGCRAAEEGTLEQLREPLRNAAIEAGLSPSEIESTLRSAERRAA